MKYERSELESTYAYKQTNTLQWLDYAVWEGGEAQLGASNTNLAAS